MDELKPEEDSDGETTPLLVNRLVEEVDSRDEVPSVVPLNVGVAMDK